MDIDLLSKMVKELILDNDKVVLPGLGTFVAEMVPAAFSDKGYTINPPYRRLYFRSKPDEGELLVKFYATSNNVDYNVADKAIKDFIAELKSILFIKKTVVFPGLGRMRATKENAVFFVADEDLDIYPEGLGLEPISLKTHQETREEVEATIVGLKALVEAPESEVEIEVVPEDWQSEVAVTAEEEVIVEDVVEVVEPVTETEPSPESGPKQIEQSVVQPIEQPVEKAMQVVETQFVEKASSKNYMKILLWVLLAAVVLLLIFVAVARLNPDLVDGLLYTPEQLEILNQ